VMQGSDGDRPGRCLEGCGSDGRSEPVWEGMRSTREKRDETLSDESSESCFSVTPGKWSAVFEERIGARPVKEEDSCGRARAVGWVSVRTDSGDEGIDFRLQIAFGLYVKNEHPHGRSKVMATRGGRVLEAGGAKSKDGCHWRLGNKRSTVRGLLRPTAR